ncbi:hypothetical protein ACLOJK_007333 [Asimina triloba]
MGRGSPPSMAADAAAGRATHAVEGRSPCLDRVVPAVVVDGCLLAEAVVGGAGWVDGVVDLGKRLVGPTCCRIAMEGRSNGAAPLPVEEAACSVALLATTLSDLGWVSGQPWLPLVACAVLVVEMEEAASLACLPSTTPRYLEEAPAWNHRPPRCNCHAFGEDGAPKIRCSAVHGCTLRSARYLPAIFVVRRSIQSATNNAVVRQPLRRPLVVHKQTAHLRTSVRRQRVPALSIVHRSSENPSARLHLQRPPSGPLAPAIARSNHQQPRSASRSLAEVFIIVVDAVAETHCRRRPNPDAVISVRPAPIPSQQPPALLAQIDRQRVSTSSICSLHI